MRNAKRAAGIDVPMHVPFREGLSDLRFAGVRSVDGQVLVLVRTGEGVMVTAIDPTAARRIARMKVGDPIRFKDGVVQGRPRRR